MLQRLSERLAHRITHGPRSPEMSRLWRTAVDSPNRSKGFTCPSSLLDKYQLMFYSIIMIKSFQHKGLRLLFEDDDRRKLNAEYVDRLRLILSLLDVAETVEDMNQLTFRLHPLKGDLNGFWAVTVQANWRVVFRFADGYAYDVDLIDYH